MQKKSPIFAVRNHGARIPATSLPWGQDSCNLSTMGPGFLQSLYHMARIPAISLPWGQDSCNLSIIWPGFLQSLYHGARIPATSLPWGQDSCNLSTMGPGFLQALSIGFFSKSSGLRTTYTPWIVESLEEKSTGVQIYVNEVCLFLKQ